MTKSKLAAEAGVALRTLTYHESGDVTPPPACVAKYADVLQFPDEFFSRPEVESLDSKGVSFRSLARMKASDRSRALAAADLALELNAWVERRFQLPEHQLPDLGDLRDPEAAAITLRNMWGLGDKPIAHMVRLLEAKGVRVFSLAEEHDSLDGFAFWRDDKPYIFLNTLKSGERGRSDAAHELAHLVLHRHGHPVGREVEHEAHTFAGAFLMPRTSLLAHAPRVPSLERLIEAKRGWGVSVANLAHRMHAIGMVSDWQYRSLCIAMGSRGFRKAEPSGAAREMSLTFEKVFAALREDGISKHALAKELGWPVAELNALVFGLVLSSHPGSADAVASEPRGRPALQLVE